MEVHYSIIKHQPSFSLSAGWREIMGWKVWQVANAEFLVDLNDFKEEVKVHKYKPYEATEFLNRVFRSDEMQIQAFLLQSDQFKESLYRIIRAMETNPDAMVNPQYLKAYADHL